MVLRKNDVAPHFDLPDQNNKPHSLTEFSGSWLLLYFYPKDFTSGCTTEACTFRDNWDEIKDVVAIVGVSADSSESHRKFVAKHSLPFLLLVDTERVTTKAYGANGIIFTKRTSFLINPQGVIAKIYRSVKPNKHAQQVLHDVESLK